MNRTEFMKQLERLLSDISESERLEAIDYYNSYFDDAGEENESKVIQELGSPGKVAAIIKADLAGGSEDYGEYTERGYEDTRMKEEKMPQVYDTQPDSEEPYQRRAYRHQRRADRGYQVPARTGQGKKILAIIGILFLAIVFGVPIVSGIASVIFGIIVSLLAAVVCLGIGAFAVAICGVVFVGVGIVTCFSQPGLGLLEMAAGMIFFAIGILLLLAFIWVGVKFLPWLIKKIVETCQKIIGRGRRKEGEPV